MRSDRRDRDREFEDRIGKLIGLVALAFLALVYPQSLGGLVGFGVGAGYPLRPGDREDRRYWRTVGGWSIAAGLAVAGAYVLLAGPFGADAELRRFHRQWGWGHFTGAALIDHPWAWLPLATAAALVAGGGAIIWRAR